MLITHARSRWKPLSSTDLVWVHNGLAYFLIVQRLNSFGRRRQAKQWPHTAQLDDGQNGRLWHMSHSLPRMLIFFQLHEQSFLHSFSDPNKNHSFANWACGHRRLGRAFCEGHLQAWQWWSHWHLNVLRSLILFEYLFNPEPHLMCKLLLIDYLVVSLVKSS